MQTRIKENTWATKEHIIRTKLIPYFGKLKMSSITAQQIITWQNELMNYKDEKGKPFLPYISKPSTISSAPSSTMRSSTTTSEKIPAEKQAAWARRKTEKCCSGRKRNI